MIVEWTKDNLKIIPIVVNKVIVKEVTLLPGNNDISNEDWKAIRESGIIDAELRRRDIKELHAEVKVKRIPKSEQEEKPGKKYKVTLESKSLRKLNMRDAEEVIANTFNIESLKRWLKNEGRDSTRAALRNRIDEIEKFGEDKAKKEAQRKKGKKETEVTDEEVEETKEDEEPEEPEEDEEDEDEDEDEE